MGGRARSAGPLCSLGGETQGWHLFLHSPTPFPIRLSQKRKLALQAEIEVTGCCLPAPLPAAGEGAGVRGGPLLLCSHPLLRAAWETLRKSLAVRRRARPS